METIPEARRQVDGSNIRAAGGNVDVSPQGAALVGSASEATQKATSAIGQIADVLPNTREKRLRYKTKLYSRSPANGV
jgi:hypothetical protein